MKLTAGLGSPRYTLRLFLSMLTVCSLVLSSSLLATPAFASHDEATAGDTDDDGVLDGSDNCPNDANPGQADTDGDGIGDVCDPDNSDGPDADPDGDGLPNSADECDNEAEDADGYQDGDGCPEPAPTVVPDLSVNATQDASDQLVGDGVCDSDTSTEGRQCTLRAAIEEANGSPGGDTIGLPDGTYLLDPELGSLDVSRNLIITGASAASTVIDGGMGTGVFDIGGTSVITVEMTDLTITGGSSGDGAGIYNDTTDLTLRNVTMADNHAHNGYGGGLYNYAGEVTLENVTFDGNHAYYYGGAVYNDEGAVSASSSVFSNNGFMTEEGVVTERTESGGAIYSYKGNLALQSTDVTGNQAYYYGAGIYSEQGTLTLSDVAVDGNSSDGSGDGVGIYTYEDEFSFTGGSVSDNTGGDSGGGIYADYSTLDFTDVTVDGNQADYYGGMYVYEGGLAFDGGSISNNTADDGYGGGLYTDYSSATLDDVTVNGNWAYYQGGGIYNYETPLTLTNSTVNDNWSDEDGGGIYHEYGPLKVVDSEINGNFAADEGAGLFKYDGVGTLIRTSVSNNGVDDDGEGNASFTYAGGGIYNDYELLTLKDSTVSGNFAESYGAGIYHYDTILELKGTTVSDNGAYDPSDPVEGDPTDPVYTDDGGGIYVDDDAVTLTDSTVDGNTAEYYGGGIYNYCCNLTLNRSTVSNNEVLDGYGGGIYNYDALKMTNSTVWGNDATYGGGIFNNGWEMKLLNVTISGNHAATGGESSTPYGGGINNDYNAVLEDTIVAGNTAGEGELLVESNCAGSSVSSQGNNLDDDGSCFAESGALGDLPGVTDALLGSLADNGGPTETVALTTGSPAIDAGTCPPPDVDQRGEARPAGAACDIGAFEFGDADAGLAPGSILVDVTDSDLSDTDPGDGSCDSDTETEGDQCTLRAAIEEAEALDGGNTVVLPAGTMTLTNGELYVEHNLILTGAGAGTSVIDGNDNDRVFYLGGPVTVEMSDLTITGGSAYDGAGIYNDAGRLTLTRVALTGNQASGYGGAVYNYQGEMTDRDVVMDGNYAGYDGGALYNDEGTVTATGSDFTNNGFMPESDDTGSGGAIYNYYGTLALSDADVTGNQAEYGGGIYSEYGTVDLTDVRVENNSALAEYSSSGSYYYCYYWWCPGTVTYGNEGTSGDGGGIYSYEDDLTFAGGSVTGNSAGDSGGGIYGDYSRLDLQGVDLDGNSASGSYHYWYYYQNYPWYNYDSSGTSGDGAGIYVYEGSMSFASGSISGNDAGAYGGGLYNDYAAMSLSGATVAGNTAVEDGGGIYNGDSPVAIAGSSITGNHSGDDGGGIYQSYGTLDVTGSAIDGNWAADEGAGLYKNDGVGTLTSTTVNGNGLPVAGSEADLSPDGGGGIYNDDDVLSLIDSTVDGNFAESYGGGIYNEDERLTLLRTSVSGNGMSNPADPEAHPHTEYGAGLYNENIASVHDSTFDGNVAHYEGGGIYNTEEMTVRGSTVSNNMAMTQDEGGGGGRGGGVANHGYLFKVINSTVSSNEAVSGGGLYNSYNLTMVNATVADNHASGGSGGIWNDDSTAVLEDTIVAGNTAADAASNCSEDGVTSEGHNLDDDGSCFGAGALSDGTGHASDLVVEDALIGALAGNGGPAMTHMLQAGSPAIDAAVCPPPNKDQRGIDRPVDGDVDGDGACDIGATEFRPSALSIDDVSVTEGNDGTISALFTVTRTGGDGAGSVAFSTHAGSAASSADFQGVSGTLSFAGNEASQTITVDVAGDVLPEPNETFTVKLAGATFATISDGTGVGTILDDGDTADEVSATVEDGGTVTTGQEATPENPTATSITTPNGGTVTIAETEVGETAPGGWTFFGQQVDITAPPATDPSDPLIIAFTLDASMLPPGVPIEDVAVFRNGSEAASGCPDLSTATAESYPCIASRTVEEDGDFTFVVRTMAASAWNFGQAQQQTGGGGGTPSYRLDVTRVGTGQGTVTSSPEGIACGATCSALFPSGTVVTLSAPPAEGSAFVAWSGACSGSEACVITMTEFKSVAANFTLVEPPAEEPPAGEEVNAESDVALRYLMKKATLRAGVTSGSQECESDRLVIFKKRRVGDDRVLARRRAGTNGVARLGGIESPNGVYYAVVKRLETNPEGSSAVLVCGADRSNLLRLGGAQ